jgi:hypothetical protein
MKVEGNLRLFDYHPRRRRQHAEKSRDQTSGAENVQSSASPLPFPPHRCQKPEVVLVPIPTGCLLVRYQIVKPYVIDGKFPSPANQRFDLSLFPGSPEFKSIENGNEINPVRRNTE